MRKIKLKVDSFDLRLLIRALSEFRNAIMAQNAPTEDVNKLLSMFLDIMDKRRI